MTKTEICSICLEGDINCELHCCGAQFHIVCISKWINKQENDVMSSLQVITACPLCRREVGVSKAQGTWPCFVWSLDKFFDQWRATQDEEFARRYTRSGSCRCTLFFSYCLVVFLLILNVFSAAAGLHGVFTWDMILLAGMYTLFLSFVDDFFTSRDRGSAEA